MILSRQWLQNFPFEIFDEVINRYNLHYQWPVKLEPLYEEMEIRIFRDMILPDGCKAFSARHSRRGSGIAVFQIGLEGPELAHAMGHEMGHLLYHKLGRLHGCINSPGGMVRREEQEADLVASYLMVPGQAVYDLCKAGYTFSEIAQTLNVTRPMLQARVDLMVIRDEFGVVSRPIFVNVE